MQELGLVVLAGNALDRNRIQACIHGQLHCLSAQRQVQVDPNLKLAAQRHLPVEFQLLLMTSLSFALSRVNQDAKCFHSRFVINAFSGAC